MKIHSEKPGVSFNQTNNTTRAEEIPTLPNAISEGEEAALPLGLPSGKAKASIIKLLYQRSFRGRSSSGDGEEAVMIRSGSPNKSLLCRTYSSSNISALAPDTRSGPLPLQGRCSNQEPIRRSFSAPDKIKMFRILDSGNIIRVISTPDHGPNLDGSFKDDAHIIENDSGGVDIREEEAVCRICLEEVGEGGETLKMECSCRGDLALAHHDCAVKWFTFKGNKTCDVCNKDVRNLPVTLLKLHHSPPADHQRETPTWRRPRDSSNHHSRVWHDLPLLIMVNVLAYFCLLEQLLVSNLGQRALAISLPFSCVFGLLSSVVASNMVRKGYQWAFAAFQFATVILLAHVFYNMLNVRPVPLVLLSSVSGFAIAVSANLIVIELLRCRESRGVLLH